MKSTFPKLSNHLKLEVCHILVLQERFKDPIVKLCMKAKSFSYGTALQVDVSKTRVEPPHDKINKMACAPSEDSDQPGQPPSLIRVFAVRMKKAWVLSYPLRAQLVFAGRTVILLILSWGGSVLSCLLFPEGSFSFPPWEKLSRRYLD